MTPVVRRRGSGDRYLGDSRPYLTEQVVTYLGNKRSLLPEIDAMVGRVVDEAGGGPISTFDAFSGSGIVSRLLKHRSSVVHSNDLEPYAGVLGECYLANRSYAESLGIPEAVDGVASAMADSWVSDGFIAEMYAPGDDDDIRPGERAFYTRGNAEFLDTAMTLIGRLGGEVRPFLVAPLLHQASVHVNTSGVFKGFHKGRDGVGRFGGPNGDSLDRITGSISLEPPVLSDCESDFSVTVMDAREAASNLPHVDLAYLDPPYNQHPYGSNYFMLNLLASYERPAEVSEVSGIPVGWNRSPYNRRSDSRDELFSLIESVDSDFVLLSYGSEGFVPFEDILSFLTDLGDVEVREVSYTAYRGSRRTPGGGNRTVEGLFLLSR